MDTTTLERTDDTQAESTPNWRVRADLVAGTAVIATVVVGNLLWHASDAGLLAGLGGH